MSASRLWYRGEAKSWVEALPLGNGRIGAMVFGGIRTERLAMNEDTFWAGYPRDKNAPDAHRYLARARELIRAQELKQAQEVVEQHMEGKYSASYLPLCDLMIAQQLGDGEPLAYERSLDMRTGIAITDFTIGDVTYHRQVFVSAPDQGMIVHLSAGKPGAVSCVVSLSSQVMGNISADNTVLTMDLRAPSRMEPNYVASDDPCAYDDTPETMGMRARVLVEVSTQGGSVRHDGQSLILSGADSAIIYFCARTSFTGFDRQPETGGLDEKTAVQNDLDSLRAQPYTRLLERHTADVNALFDRVHFTLDLPRDRSLATDERLEAFAGSGQDPELYELIYNYGRYLLFSSSRPHTQAANLQGIWNEQLRPPWSSNYTVNINTQMNYWPAEPCAMPDMAGPLFDLIDRLRVNGATTARVHYNAGGVVCHHNTDLWAMSNPVGENRPGSAVYAFWPLAYGWLCRHLMEHYEYSLDMAFLRERAWPALRDAAVFFLDTLAPNADGYLSLYPATSPENAFIVDGNPVAVAGAATMSTAIVREVFTSLLRCADILGLEDDLCARARLAVSKLPPYQIGTKGQLLEWDREYEEMDPHHRHISHLYAMHPGRELSLDQTPALAEAARQTLLLRGDEGTGWSLGWKINQWARQRDGDHALRLLKRQLRLVKADGVKYSGGGGTYPNLFDAHPPFQIDGNFGASAGIAEMLVQNAQGVVTLLPALPNEWASGSVSGLRAFGGLVIDLAWKANALTHAHVTAHAGQPVRMTIRYQQKTAMLTLVKGQTAVLSPEDFR